MGHYYSEMVSQKELDKEADEKRRDRKLLVEVIEDRLKHDSLAEVLADIIKEFRYPNSVRDRLMNRERMLNRHNEILYGENE